MIRICSNSCHYYLKQPAKEPVSRVITPNDQTCEPGTIYNTCATGALSTVIGYLNAINSLRITARLPQLKLSVGLAAGVWTPQSVLDTVSYRDFPHLDSMTAPPECFRLPLLWKSAFVTQHEAALKQLVSHIVANASVDITMLKVTGINDADIEMEVPGRSAFLAAPADLTTTPPMGSGPLIACPLSPPGTPGAQLWLSAYGTMTAPSYSDAFEATFGSIVGFEAALIQENSLDALISIANTGSSGMADVDCGIAGAGPCTVQPVGDTDDYNTYYIAKYAKDIFTTPSVANTAAATAYSSEIHGGTFALTSRQISVNWTALSQSAIVPGDQLTCWMNNELVANQHVFSLDGTNVDFLGPGTVIGWQTTGQLETLCNGMTTDGYSEVMNYGLAAGAQYLEVERPAAQTQACSAALSAALSTITAIAGVTHCNWPMAQQAAIRH